MKICRMCWVVALVGVLAALTVDGREAQFFRISGPAASGILSVTPDGTIAWTNARAAAVYTFQASTTVSGITNWVDYVKVSGTAGVNSNKLFAPSIPAGMAYIPAGWLVMGNCMDTNEGVAYELPVHWLSVSAFYVDKYLVTKVLWDEVYQWGTNHGYSFANLGSWSNGANYSKGTNHPVHSVTWYDMVKWCNARSQKEGLTPCYTSGGQATVYQAGTLDLTNACVNWTADGYRLPTEAEWEKAARGGASGHRFAWNDTDVISWARANYNVYQKSGGTNYYSYDVNPAAGYNPAWVAGGAPYTTAVGSFAANGYGLFDMTGNVWQWCWDWWDYSWYSMAGAYLSDSRGPNTAANTRVLRGGSWMNDAKSARCAYRSAYLPAQVVMDIGFRCVRRQ